MNGPAEFDEALDALDWRAARLLALLAVPCTVCGAGTDVRCSGVESKVQAHAARTRLAHERGLLPLPTQVDCNAGRHVYARDKTAPDDQQWTCRLCGAVSLVQPGVGRSGQSLGWPA